MLGRTARACRFRAGIPAAGRHRPGRRVESKPAGYGSLRSAHKQFAVAQAPGSVLLTAGMTGLPKDAVANVSQVVALDRALLEERTGRISQAKIDLLLAGLDIVLGR